MWRVAQPSKSSVNVQERNEMTILKKPIVVVTVPFGPQKGTEWSESIRPEPATKRYSTRRDPNAVSQLHPLPSRILQSHGIDRKYAENPANASRYGCIYFFLAGSPAFFLSVPRT